MFQMPSASLPAEAVEKATPSGISPALKKQMGMLLAQQAMGSMQKMAAPPMMTKTQPQLDQYGNSLGMLGY